MKKDIIAKIIAGFLCCIPISFFILVCWLVFNYIPDTSIDKNLISAEINNVDFKIFSNNLNDLKTEKQIELDNGKIISIKKSVTHPEDMLIVTYKINDNNNNNNNMIIKIKNIDGKAQVVSVTDKNGKEIK